MSGNSTEPVRDIVLSAQDKQLLQIIRGMKQGELHIAVSRGEPIRVEEIMRGIEL